MINFKCSYETIVNDERAPRSEIIQAESSQKAYELFLANQGVFPVAVNLVSGYGEETFTMHIEEDGIQKNEDKLARLQAATKDALSSLTSTDLLLKQLIEKQTELIEKQAEANKWLKQIRWGITGITVILLVWNIRVFG